MLAALAEEGERCMFVRSKGYLCSHFASPSYYYYADDNDDADADCTKYDFDVLPFIFSTRRTFCLFVVLLFSLSQ